MFKSFLEAFVVFGLACMLNQIRRFHKGSKIHNSSRTDILLNHSQLVLSEIEKFGRIISQVLLKFGKDGIRHAQKNRLCECICITIFYHFFQDILIPLSFDQKSFSFIIDKIQFEVIILTLCQVSLHKLYGRKRWL